jgi:hypothetical protein
MALIRAVNVTAQDFTKNLVLHGNVGLAPNVVLELGLNHHDRGFFQWGENVTDKEENKWT